MISKFRSIGSITALCCAAVALPAYAGAPSSADKVFVGKVSQGGMYEVEASKVAEQQGSAQYVKDIASAEVHDHELVNAKLKNIAKMNGIDVSSKLNDTFQERLDKLKGMSGAAFDAAYIADMKQIHDNDEKLFAREAMDGSNAFKMFAHETDLVVKTHIGALNGVSMK